MKKSTYRIDWIKSITWIGILIFCISFWSFVGSQLIKLIWG